MEPYRSPSHARAKQRDSRLTWDDVHEIRRRAQAGHKQQVIADDFGITNQAVALIVKNERWRDPDYVWEGHHRTCAEPDCAKPFVTRQVNQTFCSKKCQLRHHSRKTSGFYLRHEEREWMRRRTGVGRPGTAIATASSLDKQLGDSSATLMTFAADARAVDPQVELEVSELSDLLEGLDEDSVAQMSHDELIQLRIRLAKAGFRPVAA